MTSVNTIIHNLLSKHISIQKCLKRDLINTRSLARFLVDEYKLDFSLDSVISSVRRFDLNKVSLLASKEAEEAFHSMIISIKDNVARIVVEDAAFKEIAQDYISEQKLKKNVRIVKSKEIVTLIVNQKDIEEKVSLFKRESVLQVDKDLAEVRLQFSKDVSKVKGLVAAISGEIALRDINILDIIYSLPDLLLYIKQEHVGKVHTSLQEMKR